MTNAQINPLLIQQLTGKRLAELPNSPTRTVLPGEYAQLVYKQKGDIKRHFSENYFMIKCKTCGRKGKYDVGLMLVNRDKTHLEDAAASIQTTGYFRCKHCNDAGNWELPKEFIIKSTASLFEMLLPDDTGLNAESQVTVGNSQLYDGSEHKFASDGEMHLLQRLKEDEMNSFIWNRLGNLYDKGNRQVIAAAVYEHSLTIDPKQIESSFTLAGYFLQMGELEKSTYHFKQVLLNAGEYKYLKAETLRDMLTNCLIDLLYIHQYSQGEISFLPTFEELKMAGKSGEIAGKIVDLELDLYPSEPASFYPLAEMYMGKQRSKSPKKSKTLK